MLNIDSGNAELDEMGPWLVALTAGTQDGGKWPSQQAVKHGCGVHGTGDRGAQKRGDGQQPGLGVREGSRGKGGPDRGRCVCASVRPCLRVLGPCGLSVLGCRYLCVSGIVLENHGAG